MASMFPVSAQHRIPVTTPPMPNLAPLPISPTCVTQGGNTHIRFDNSVPRTQRPIKHGMGAVFVPATGSTGVVVISPDSNTLSGHGVAPGAPQPGNRAYVSGVVEGQRGHRAFLGDAPCHPAPGGSR